MPAPTSADASHAARFALTLLALDGVGAVTAGRLVRAFGSLQKLRSTPREQVLLRLKGLPRAGDLVTSLFEDDELLRDTWAEVRADLDALAKRGVRVLTPRDPHWPPGLDALEGSEQPAVLYHYGHPEALAAPSVALLADAPLEDLPFGMAQRLGEDLVARGIRPVVAARPGFDVALVKRALGPESAKAARVLAVAQSGFAHVPPPVRPAVSALVKRGGGLCSVFPMEHGPFEHDAKTRAKVQAAVASAVVAVSPRADTPTASALKWAVAAGRPTFVIGSADPTISDNEGFSASLHPIRHPDDFAWVGAAVGGDSG